MNPDSPKTPQEEMETRLLALLLGELPAEEAVAWRAAIATNPELAKLHGRLKQTVNLVREAAAIPTEPKSAPAAPLQLSEERRKRLLTRFLIPPLKERDRKPQRRFPLTLVEVLVVVAIMGILAAMMLPALSNAKSKSQSIALRSNLQQLKIAKEQWAADNNRSLGDAPTPTDLKPYLGGRELPLTIGGETYVLGRVGEPVSVEVDADQARKRFGRLPATPPAGGAPSQRVRLSSDGQLAFVDQKTIEEKLVAQSKLGLDLGADDQTQRKLAANQSLKRGDETRITENRV